MGEAKLEILDQASVDRILNEEDTAVLCMSAGDQPYGIPISYAMIDGKLIFHCAGKGRKLDVLRKNPRVCVIVDRHPDRMKPHHPEGKCEYRYESVVCFGQAEIVEDVAKKREWLEKFRTYFGKRLARTDTPEPLSEIRAASTGCVLIHIDEYSGRRKN